MTEKSLIIIGAGLAGLSAGCYCPDERLSEPHLRAPQRARWGGRLLETQGLPRCADAAQSTG